MDEIRLIRNLSELRGTCYFELLPGEYAGQCWNEQSVFVEEEVFCLLERVIARHVPSFDHYAFTEVPRQQWLPLLQHLTQLAAQLDVATGIDDVRGELAFLFTHSEQRFAADFAKNARALVVLTREMVAWVDEQLKTHAGVAILGI